MNKRAEFNPNPDEKLVKAIYNGLYGRRARDRAEASSGKKKPRKERANGKDSRARRLDKTLPAFLGRAQTHDHAAKQPDPDSAHVTWLADSLLAEVRRAGPRATIAAGTRLALIHELPKVDS